MRIWHNILKTLTVLTVLWCALGQSAQAQTGNDQRPGSVLFYNIYTSSSTNPSAVNTQVSITNTSPDTDIHVHLFFVDGFTCQVADSFLFLTRNQTMQFLASDIDPDVKGYIVAVAVNLQGLPTQHNFLIGSLTVKLTLGPTTNTTHSSQLTAVAFVKNNSLAPTVSADGVTADLVFDGNASGSSYEQLPSEVAIDNFESPATADTRLIIYSPKSSFYAGGDTGGRLFIIFYDDQEAGFSAMVGLNCWLQARLTTIRNITTRVTAGHTGWARFTGTRDTTAIPLLGSVIQASDFYGGHNLHHLKAYPSYTITIPVFAP